MRKKIVLLLFMLMLVPAAVQAVEFMDSNGGIVSVEVAATYSMKIVVSMPAGSEGGSLATTQPSNTKLSPCVDATKVDAVTFTLTYNAGSPADKDVYLFLFNPNASGTGTNYRFYAIKKGTLTSPVAVTNRLDVPNLVAASDIYLPKASNPGGVITETLLGGSIILDGAPSGTWQMVGIVADNTTVNFDDPSTWAAWDVGTLVIRKPWPGATNATCL